ncbi:MAG: macro domain-containing protein [Chitinophagales bacterium]|jgi:O-acetyl-ADP-ribose deacetylase (regulator of RNase III)|nr:macro domain-containing protein [Chitinophagales bacterium]
MIQYITGNLLESDAEALVNTVNTVGVMGKGIALQFKNAFPDNYKKYVHACKQKTLQVGTLLVVQDHSQLYGTKIIINFPTKTDWRKPSEYTYVEQGLSELSKYIEDHNIKSIAIPPLGAGNGGLLWANVKTLIHQYLAESPATIWVYEPNYAVQEILKKERVPLTPARAMLLAVLYELVSNGEFVSEFACEKVCYFLQRFGADEHFKLNFEAQYYGPYSGKVKHVLYYLNGSYLRGYSSKDKKPFEILDLLVHFKPDVLAYLKQYPKESQIVAATSTFLEGWYGNFDLELLSTLDYLVQTKKTTDIVILKAELARWNARKSKLFADKSTALEMAIQKVVEIEPIN